MSGKNKKKIIRYSVLALLAAVAAVGVIFFVLVVRSLDSPLNIPSGGSVFFEVEKGWTLGTTIDSFCGTGLPKHPGLFEPAFRLFFRNRTVKAGEYRFTSPMTARQAMAMMFEGKVYLVPITIPEGLTGREVRARLEEEHPAQAEGLAGAMKDVSLISDLDPSARDLEGYLFPETYMTARKAGARDLVRAMTAQFHRVFDGDMRKRAAELGMSVRQVVTLASLIEKETSLAEERPLVSSVFHNRLRIGMKLDCDPTVIYALELAGLYKGRLLKKDLTFDSPYNTYANGGLPPGPICNPGRESIRAALYPQTSNYLYFVARGDGGHQFNSSFELHQAAVGRLRSKRSGTGPSRRTGLK